MSRGEEEELPLSLSTNPLANTPGQPNRYSTLLSGKFQSCASSNKRATRSVGVEVRAADQNNEI